MKIKNLNKTEGEEREDGYLQMQHCEMYFKLLTGHESSLWQNTAQKLSEFVTGRCPRRI